MGLAIGYIQPPTQEQVAPAQALLLALLCRLCRPPLLASFKEELARRCRP
jgi:hypothetical protein